MCGEGLGGAVESRRRGGGFLGARDGVGGRELHFVLKKKEKGRWKAAGRRKMPPKFFVDLPAGGA